MKISCWMILADNTHLRWRYIKKSATRLTVIISLLLSACSDIQQKNIISIEGPTMGTRYTITLIDPPRAITKKAIQTKIEREIAIVNQWMSNYISDSEISLINGAPINVWLPLSEETYSVIETAQEISAKTDGSFDITVSPLVSLWGFGPDKHENIPSTTEIDATRVQVGWQYIQLNADRRSLLKTAPVIMDLSAIAKGFGVDYLSDFLDLYSIENYLVEIGGEIRVKGYNADGEKWRIGIESPTLARSGIQQAVTITDKAVATSGDYRNYYEKDGIRYSHTIDPSTGRPVEHNVASVTVISDSATEADGWATAFNVMRPEKAMELAEKHQLAVYLLIYDQEEYKSRHSSEFAQYMGEIK